MAASHEVGAPAVLLAAPALQQATHHHISKAPRLATVHAWLHARDIFELVQNAAESAASTTPNVSAMCQLQLSTGLVLAPLGDRRYYACDELKKLSTSE